MNKIIIFSVPSEITNEAIIAKLTEAMSELNIQSHAIILTENDLSCTTKQVNPALTILRDIVKICGNGKNRIEFNINFYRALANGFYTNNKDMRIILTEIINGQNDPEVITFAKANCIPFIFNLAEEALGMMR